MQGSKWIFFDIGSTLMDETEAYNHRIREAIAGTDITFDEFQEKRLEFAKQNLKSDIEALKFYGLSKPVWHREDEVPYPEAEEILKYLKSLGYKLGVIANQSHGTAERLEQWNLLQYIDVVAASAELGIAKPDPAIFHKAMELADCTAEEAVMVGDRLDNDIAPAKKLGMRAIWVKQGFNAYQNVEALEAQHRPDATIENLAELKSYFHNELTGYILPVNSQEHYKYVVVCSNYQGKWLFSRHKERTTWETQGGHIEEGETPYAAAVRELYEESGVTIENATLHEVCAYKGTRGEKFAYGVVYLAKVKKLGELPESEMQEVRLFEELPENLTYPLVTPLFIEEAKGLMRRMERVIRIDEEIKRKLEGF